MSPKQLHEEVFHVNENKFMLQKKKKKKIPTQKCH